MLSKIKEDEDYLSDNGLAVINAKWEVVESNQIDSKINVPDYYSPLFKTHFKVGLNLHLNYLWD